jgi:hypothetical protein
MLERLRDKRVDPDWLNTNFPCMAACRRAGAGVGCEAHDVDGAAPLISALGGLEQSADP